MRNDHRRLVLVVDTDQRFIDDARPLLAAHRVLTARDLDEAREIVLGGRVDLVLLGPAFGSGVAIAQAHTLFAADSSLQVALAADVVTNRLLKAALKGGLTDVLDTPIAARDLADLIGQLPSLPRTLTEIELVVEAAAETAVPAPDASRRVDSSMPAVDAGHVSQPEPAPTLFFEPPMSEATPAEIAFVSEDVASRLSREVAGTSPSGHTAPIAESPPVERSSSPIAIEHPEPAPHLEAPPSWPVEEGGGGAAPPPPAEVLPPERPVSPPAAPVVREGPKQAHPLSTPVPDILDQVMPPPAMPPPSVPPEAGPPAAGAGPSVAPEGGGSEPAVDPSGPGRVIVVMAGKGGSGKTITATNLAIAIGLRADPERVAIVDADLQFGDVALLLRLDPVRTLDDLVGRVDRMSDARIDGALLRHESGIRVLPAPVLPVPSGEIDAKSVVEVVDRLCSVFDTVVVDTGSVFDDGLVTILERADQIVTVVDMDLPSVKNAKIVLDALRRVGFDMDRIRVVVNRANSKARLDLVELERSLGLRVRGSIPSDRLIPQSVNRGTPVLSMRPRSKVARAFVALAESLDSDREQLPAR